MFEETQFPAQKLGDVVEVLDHFHIPVNSEARGKRKGDVPYYSANGLQGWIDKPLFNEPLILMAEDGGRPQVPSATLLKGARATTLSGFQFSVMSPLSGSETFVNLLLPNQNFVPFSNCMISFAGGGQ